MKKLTKVWNKYYDESQKNTILKDDSFFKLEIDAIIENLILEINKIDKSSIKILELGSGTGFLASKIIQSLKKNKIQCNYTGIDFSIVAIQKANNKKIKNCEFINSDFINFLKSNKEKYDFVITQRSIMAIMEKTTQLVLLKLIKKSLLKKGSGLFCECTVQALKKIQKLRKDIGILPLDKIWHSKYVDKNTISSLFTNVKVLDFASTYWFLTRIIYPYFEEPKHNTIFHQFASTLPQEGGYGLVKLFIVQK
jgi:ubiquinone/menaquinone biosynthesis C-methylase UbiE|tara:strand:- start:492 stop:1247 length:756 start_codon:yes stop_codon:yes gene_type:complete